MDIDHGIGSRPRGGGKAKGGANRGARGTPYGRAVQPVPQGDLRARISRAGAGAAGGSAVTRVFVGNLSWQATEQDLLNVMSSAGKVVSVNILRELNGRSKGCAIVTFVSAAAAQRAMATLEDFELDGRLIWLREDREADAPAAPNPGCRVYVGNLSWQTTWMTLKDVMRQAGDVTHVDILTEPGGRSKGCALVELAHPSGAARAMHQLQDVAIDGRLIWIREDREAGAGPAQGPAYNPGPVYGGRGHAALQQPHPHAHAFAQGGSGGGAAFPVPADVSASVARSCRIFVNNLSKQVDWKELKDVMRTAGDVVHVDILTDAAGRSKGCATVQFANAESALAAIQRLEGTVIQGWSIRLREDREAGGAAPAGPAHGGGVHGTRIVVANGDGGGARAGGAAVAGANPRVFVGNLSWQVGADELMPVMQQAGSVVSLEVLYESGGRSKGCAIVEYASPEDAETAISTLQDVDVGGRQIWLREDREAGRC